MVKYLSLVPQLATNPILLNDGIKKHTHVVKYRDIEPVEMPNLKAKSFVLRFSLNLTNVKS